ncbi:hypothetical protein H70357_21935 [Paenibacillus sp. FSL H7-0357]|uniref:hypothetical protein n=1 Tax=Paenibacillus sp. FSL H7-0357 TaxID=1536774 RepID=UPI0004F60D85|nr:hypothetical protein [Paenibacillus sp. FSL H7-0357]AIQ19071.1 hypothetical protein H70357_21935 [Paenibacillus sp. FSL H7-0357]
MGENKIGASDYLGLGLYAFAGFGLEIVLSMLLPFIFGVGGSEYTLIDHCIHWVLTCILWGSMALFLIRLSKKKYSFDIMKLNEAPDSKGWLLAVVISVIAITVTTIAWGGFKPVQEYNGIVKFIFQNIYYLFEAALILLTIVFGQKFGETLMKRGGLPYGGIFLALTWGLIHILLQGSLTGVYAFFMSILYGIVYILLKKNIRYSYMMMVIIFIL